MPVLSINKPLEQGEPVLLVENRLAVGRHRFSLVVVDNDGIASDAAFFTVTVRDPRITFPPAPGSVITPVRPRRPRGPTR